MKLQVLPQRTDGDHLDCSIFFPPRGIGEGGRLERLVLPEEVLVEHALREEAEQQEQKLASRLRAEAAAAPDSEDGRRKRASADKMSNALKEIDQHLGKIQKTIGLAKAMSGAPGFLQKGKKKH